MIDGKIKDIHLNYSSNENINAFIECGFALMFKVRVVVIVMWLIIGAQRYRCLTAMK